jgi:hypothetical protein
MRSSWTSVWSRSEIRRYDGVHPSKLALCCKAHIYNVDKETHYESLMCNAHELAHDVFQGNGQLHNAGSTVCLEAPKQSAKLHIDPLKTEEKSKHKETHVILALSCVEVWESGYYWHSRHSCAQRPKERKIGRCFVAFPE